MKGHEAIEPMVTHISLKILFIILSYSFRSTEQSDLLHNMFTLKEFRVVN